MLYSWQKEVLMKLFEFYGKGEKDLIHHRYARIIPDFKERILAICQGGNIK